MAEETTTPQPSISSSNNLVKYILSAALGFLLLGGSVYACYWYGNKQARPVGEPTPVSQPLPVPTPEVTPSIPAPDPTVSWEAYEYPQIGVQIKLPSGWTLRGQSEEQPYLYDSEKQQKIIVALGNISFWEEPNEKRTLGIYFYDLSDSNQAQHFRENLDLAESAETVRINKREFKRFLGVKVEVGPGYSRKFTFWTLEEGNRGAKFMIGDRYATDTDLEESLIRQILSTFKFLE